MNGALNYLLLILSTHIVISSLSNDEYSKSIKKNTFKLLSQHLDQIPTTLTHRNQSSLLIKKIDPKRHSSGKERKKYTMNLTTVDKRLLKSINKIKTQKAMQKVITEINIYLTTIICFAGIIGNLLSLKVFCSKKIPCTSSLTYLIALTITDSLYLMVHFLDNTCREIVTHFQIEFPLNIIDQKVTICRASSLIRSACRCASPWIIVAFTLERFIVVNYPIHSNIISRPHLAKRLVFIILSLSVLISLYSPALSGIVYYARKNSLSNRLYTAYKKTYNIEFFKEMHFEEMFFEKSCDILSPYRTVYIYLTLVYTVIVVVIPLIVVSIFNTLLIVHLYQSTDQWTSAKLKLHEQDMSYKELRDKKVQIENFKITWMLIIISASFIVLTLPHTFLYFVWTIPKLSNNPSSKSNFFFNISSNVMKLTELLYVLNHSINFLLYTVTRHSFRKVLKEQLNCFKIFHVDSSNRYNNMRHLKGTASRRFNLSNRFMNNSSKRGAQMATKQVAVKLPNQSVLNNTKHNLDYETYWDTMPLSERPVANKVTNVLEKNAEKKDSFGLKFLKRK